MRQRVAPLLPWRVTRERRINSLRTPERIQFSCLSVNRFLLNESRQLFASKYWLCLPTAEALRNSRSMAVRSR